jgi:hypothetical protein
MSGSQVFQLRAHHLGDHWAATCFLLFESELIGSPVRIQKTGICDGETWDVEPFVRRIATLIDSEGCLAFTDESGEGIDYWSMWRRSLPTRVQWRPGGQHVCVQLTGRWSSSQKDCSAEDIDLLYGGLTDLDLSIVQLGLPMSLEDGVEMLATCRFFVGIDSGYMHVAHSIGCPRYLVRNKMPYIDAVHGGRTWTSCDNLRNCLDLIRRGLLPFQGM